LPSASRLFAAPAPAGQGLDKADRDEANDQMENLDRDVSVAR
jgi:hypothetical protein